MFAAEHEAKAKTIAGVLSVAMHRWHSQAPSHEHQLDSMAAAMGLQLLVAEPEVGSQWWQGPDEEGEARGEGSSQGGDV